MKIYPAIDLLDGQCVRLTQGDYQQQTRYTIPPQQLVADYIRAGAAALHIVDLNAAKSGADENLSTLHALVSDSQTPIQIAGGVRCLDDLTQRLQTGAQRVVVGSFAVQQPDEFRTWLRHFGGERIVAAIDVKQSSNGEFVPHTNGWMQASACELFDLVETLSGGGLRHLLCTDIQRDGMLNGPNIELYQRLQSCFPNLHIQASGGIGSLADIRALRQTDVAAAICGKALLDGRINLREAMAAAQ